MTDGVLIAAGVTGLAGAGLAAKGYTNIFSLEVNQIDLTYANLPAAFDDFKILHLSDLHIRKWGIIEEKLRIVLELHPVDLTVITGDLVTIPSGLEPFSRLLRSIRSKCGAYIVFGNTEHAHWNHHSLIDIFEAEGAHVLSNESVPVERSGEVIQLAGVDDPFTGHANVGKALAGIPAERFKILLSHVPIVADDAARQGVSLMLSGHTHGGQVRLPHFGAIRTHLPRYRELVMGLYEGDKLGRIIHYDPGCMKVYVSRGIGTSYIPIRFLCPPEIPLYVLHKV